VFLCWSCWRAGAAAAGAFVAASPDDTASFSPSKHGGGGRGGRIRQSKDRATASPSALQDLLLMMNSPGAGSGDDATAELSASILSTISAAPAHRTKVRASAGIPVVCILFGVLVVVVCGGGGAE
jgi:hypothetical protein